MLYAAAGKRPPVCCEAQAPMAASEMASEVGAVLGPYARRAEALLEQLLVEPGTPEALAEAMRYCVLGGGKRLRPGLVWLAAEAVGGQCSAAGADVAAAAVELVHCYSMVHDDLPSMDDDSMRRGRPTAHVRFGEAMAILVGDALLTRAFGLLAGAGDAAGALAAELAAGAGAAGMIAGQTADMGLSATPSGVEGIQYIHARKTGALIRAAARMGARCGGAEAAPLGAVTGWAERIGMAFQLVDDLLDLTGTAEQIGKTPGKDVGAGKRNAAAEMGEAGLVRLVEELTAGAAKALSPLAGRGEKLRQLGEALTKRKR
jgi:geranylgeranyl pyrophosphate synthase